MKSKDYQYTKKRRGLSSIVGALLFVVLMVATFSVLGIALNSQTDIVETSRAVADIGLKQQQEDFVVSSIIQPVADDLEVKILNLGQNPTEIFTLVITEVDNGPAFPVVTYDIPSSTGYLAPGDDVPADIISTTPIFLDLADPLAVPPTTELEYEIKVISSLGKIETLNIVCDEFVCGPPPGAPAGPSSMVAQLFLDGPNGVNTKTSTIILFVTNNGQQTLTGVGPLLGLGVGECDDMWQGNILVPPPDEITDVDPCNLDSPNPVTLIAGQSALFKWDGTILGDVDDEAIFCNQASGTDEDGNPVPSNTVCDGLTVIDPNDCGLPDCGGGGEGGETIILIDDLLIKPSLFLTIPSPYGSAASSANDDTGLWGIQVANPLNFTIGVSKVTITAFAPGANNNVRLYDSTANNENVSPAGAGMGDWILTTGDENVLVWKNVLNPVILPPYSTETFMIKVKPFTNNVDLEAVIVQTSIFSTAGSFGKAAYQTTMFPGGGSNDAPVANMFMSAVIDSTDTADIRGHRNNMTNGTSADFIIVMADMDSNDQSFIKQDSEFIINVPREWSQPVINFADTTKIIVNATQPDIIKHNDGSWQIIGLLSEDIGDQNSKEATTISFSTTAPEEKVERLYIMYVLGNGLSENNHSVGPLSEIVLHVIGNVTGYP